MVYNNNNTDNYSQFLNSLSIMCTEGQNKKFKN